MNKKLSPNELKDILRIKREAFYNMVYQGLYDNCMEQDKQILVLSTAGIGVLITIFYNNISSASNFILWLLSILVFLCDILLVFFNYEHNKNILQKIILNQEVKSARWLDWGVRLLFMLGIIFTFSLAYLESDYQIIINKKEINFMSTKRKGNLDPIIPTNPDNPGTKPNNK